MKVNKKLNKGFTIIELMIVLGIAGLLMLIVFLAVPALQRNSKNTGFRQEAARVLAAAQEWSTNNNGKVPGFDASNAFNTTQAGTDATSIKDLANMKNFTALTIQNHANGTINSTTFTTSTVLLRVRAKCDDTNVNNFKEGTGRQIAVYYWIESSTGNQDTLQCASS